jgi:hypothetical protein
MADLHRGLVESGFWIAVQGKIRVAALIFLVLTVEEGAVRVPHINPQGTFICNYVGRRRLRGGNAAACKQTDDEEKEQGRDGDDSHHDLRSLRGAALKHVFTPDATDIGERPDGSAFN